MTDRFFGDFEKQKRDMKARIEAEKVRIPRESADQITRQLERMEAEYSSLASSRKAILDRARGQLAPKAIEAMEKEYQVWENNYQNWLGRVRDQLRIREDYEKEQAEATRQENKTRAAAERDQFKDRARRVFLDNGGDPDDFEKAFPAIWEAELNRRVTSDLRTENGQFQREIHGLFSGPGNSGQGGNG